jgi:hypothetical protein
MPTRQLFLHVRGWICGQHKKPVNHVLETLALMVSGLILGRSAPLWEIAVWIPWDIQLTSGVRRFERWLADPHVKVADLFAPFVWAMQAPLSNETVYLILACTQVGPRCRTLLASLAYHETVLPLGWQSVAGKKGHVTGEFQKALLTRLHPYLQAYQHVIVLGDAEYCNATVITWVQEQHWDFVFHTGGRNLVRTPDDPAWQPVAEILATSAVRAGQVRHWAAVCFTQEHRLADLTLTIQCGVDEKQPIGLISNLPGSAQPHLVYERRFWIETLFGSCKSRGFGLARTHLTEPEHIDRLILAIALATHMTLGLGTHLVLTQQTHRVDRTDRRDLSLFQIGWRWLHRLLAPNRLQECKMEFSWHFTLPKPGFRPAT